MRHAAALALVLWSVLGARESVAQPLDAAGTRPAGMAGAFVAVADDASAVYWNPGGLAAASYFSLVVDRTEGRTGLGEASAGGRSSFLLALAAPALGLSYYRLRSTTFSPPDLATVEVALGRNVIGPADVRLDTLVTHHAGATLVQSVTEGIAVGATLKLVRGTAFSGLASAADRRDLLDEGTGLVGRSSTQGDLDVGVMASSGPFRLGLTIRNVTEPAFDTADPAVSLKLQRQARAGAAVRPMAGWTLAADLDLLKTDGIFGEVRDAAFGAEGRLARRAFVRGGFRFNTAGDDRATSASAGASYAVGASFLVDAQVTAGSKRSARGWGVAGRFVY